MKDEYLISRKGSNAANQSMQDLRPLLLIEADTSEDARNEFESTWIDDFTFYANQSIWVQDVDELNEAEYDSAQEVDEENRRHIREGFVI